MLRSRFVLNAIYVDTCVYIHVSTYICIHMCVCMYTQSYIFFKIRHNKLGYYHLTDENKQIKTVQLTEGHEASKQ